MDGRCAFFVSVLDKVSVMQEGITPIGSVVDDSPGVWLYEWKPILLFCPGVRESQCVGGAVRPPRRQLAAIWPLYLSTDYSGE